MKVAPNEAPQRHPKLEMATTEIQAILEKYDIAGMILIFTPGFIKPVLHLSPDFSCVGINETYKLKITPPILDTENPAPYQQKITDTINMLGNFRIYAGKLAMTVTQAEIQVRNHFNVMLPKGPGNLPINN